MTNQIQVGGMSYPNSIVLTSYKYEVKIKTNPVLEVQEPKRIDNKTNRVLGHELSAPIMLSIMELVLYYFRNKPLFTDYLYGYKMSWIMVSSLLIITLFISFSKSIKMNHGAEHKVLVSYKNNDIDNSYKYPIHTEMCGGNLLPPMILFILLSDIIIFPLTINLVYILLYAKVKSFRRLVYPISSVTQYLSTMEPSKELIDVTKLGLKKLIEKENST